MGNHVSEKLASIGQSGVLRFFDSLSESDKSVLSGQLSSLDLDSMKELIETQVKTKALFQVFAEQLLNWSRQTGKSVPWYIMTSDVNDAPTRAFFKKHNYFGYNPADVVFFQQGMMPAFSFTGEMLLEKKNSLA